MKFIITVLGFVLVAGLIYQVLPDPEIEKRQVVSNNVQELKEPDSWWFETKAESLTLVVNPEMSQNSREIATQAGCRSGINAYFYDEHNKPLGWLVVNGEALGKYYKSNLLNGVIYILNGVMHIGRQVPERAEFGHQSGPLIIENRQDVGGELNKMIKDRRSVAILTTNNRAVFAVFDDATLADLAGKIAELGQSEGFLVQSAINLDGGSSTSFWTDGSRVNETFFSGGWWCERYEGY